MTLWVDNRPDLPAGSPMTHVLVVGTSAYLHISDGPDPKANIDFGLTQLTTPCSGALAFATWLRDEYHNPGAPVGTIRLFLSPSPAEEQANPELTADPVDRSLTDDVETALFELHDECQGDPNGVAISYLSGHGVQRTKQDGNVLLEDFGVNPMVVGQSVDVFSVHQGMAGDDMPQTQFYFVDACRTQPDEFKDWKDLGQGLGLPAMFGGADGRCAPIYFAASPDAKAFGKPTAGTLYAEALMESLRSLAAKFDDDTGRIVVSSHSLGEALEKRVAAIAADFEAVQSPTPSGLVRYGVFHVYLQPPEVPVAIEVEPAQAAADTELTLTSDGMTPIDGEMVDPNPLERKIPMGMYSADVKPPAPFQTINGIPILAKPRRDGGPPTPRKVVVT